jgi:hypothetical protein
VGLGLLLRSRNNIFYGVGSLASRPTPNLEDQGIPFRLGHHPWPVWHGRPKENIGIQKVLEVNCSKSFMCILVYFCFLYQLSWSILVAARSKTWVSILSLAWIAGFELRRGHGCAPRVVVVFCQVEVSVSGWSLVQRSPTECGVSEWDREASAIRRSWPTRGLLRHGKKNQQSWHFKL